jgi:hypothetical protein
MNVVLLCSIGTNARLLRRAGSLMPRLYVGRSRVSNDTFTVLLDADTGHHVLGKEPGELAWLRDPVGVFSRSRAVSSGRV